MIASGYSLDLYCDNVDKPHPYDYFPMQYADERSSDCWKRARLSGWKLNKKKGTAICPICTGAREWNGKIFYYE